MAFQLRAIIFIFLIFGQYQCQNHLPQNEEFNGGLFLPSGFKAVVFIDSIKEKARHIATHESKSVFVNLRYSNSTTSMALLQDIDEDGIADVIQKFGHPDEEYYGSRRRTSSNSNNRSRSRTGRMRSSYETAVKINNGYLYFSTEHVVYRYKLQKGKLLPEGNIEIIMTDDLKISRRQHIGKPIAFDNKGYMYVPFGGPTNACQEEERVPFSPGVDPCPQLETCGGIWRFDANKVGQTQKDGYRFATGIRSVVALDWNPKDESLYAVVHGRDDLLRLFPDKYSPWESAMLPSEEFIKITEGSDFGWPYCYYDQIKEKKVLAPEYGGDGEIVGRCNDCDDPIFGFPGHWAPNELVFYRGDQFPDRYKNGAFIAFHGSTNRAPYPQSGYFVGFVPFKNGKPTGEWEIFADGFIKSDPLLNVDDAEYRPMGIAVDEAGALYLSDTEKGKIWKVSFLGDKRNFGKEQLAKMENRKKLSHIRTPHEIDDNHMRNISSRGEKVYYTICSACHQDDGEGTGDRFPSLVGTDWVLGDKSRLIKVILQGLSGEIQINGEIFNGVMPANKFLSDEDIALTLTYIRSSFGNNSSPISTEEVKQVRESL